MKRRNFIATLVGTLAASTLRIPAAPAVVDPLAGYTLLETTSIRGYFSNGVFFRVYERLWHPDAVVVNHAWFDAPVEVEVWVDPEKKVVCVARERVSGEITRIQESCGRVLENNP